MFYVVALSGKIGSGKSTISTTLAKKLQFNSVNFGDYIRKIASKKEIEPTRLNLQNLGESLMNENTHKFCLNVLNQVSHEKPLIVDGIRHLKALEEIKKIIFPNKLFHIHLDIKEDTRFERVNKRQSISKEEIEKIDSHSTENDVTKILIDIADMVIDANNEVEESVQKINSWLQKNI